MGVTNVTDPSAGDFCLFCVHLSPPQLQFASSAGKETNALSP